MLCLLVSGCVVVVYFFLLSLVLVCRGGGVV